MAHDVLIAGAGPTGLALALWLTRQGVRVRILDKSRGPGETSRAMAVQARTLELYRQLDLADAVVAAGHVNPTVNLWVRGRRAARVPLREAGADVTPYPFVLVYPQDRHEWLLVDRLRALGVEVERETELVSFEQAPGGVTARLRGPDGAEQTAEARYLAGCDGARSPVRHAVGSTFEGGTYRQLFYVADVDAAGLEPPGEVHVALDTADIVAVLAYGDGGGAGRTGTGTRSRLIGTVRDDRADRPAEGPEALTFDSVKSEAMARLGLRVEAVHWFSTYRVHHRVTDRFRHGRVFLLGDAAHVHSPVGGQGMNTGIGDAVNLAWKLAAVVQGRAPDALLDSYDAERRAFARSLVETTDRLFTLATADGPFAGVVRTRLAPLVARAASRVGSAREFLFRRISQTMLHYRESPMSAGTAGRVSGGDRLPWVPAGASDNYEPLREIAWQVHVYGTPRADLVAWCEREGIALHAVAWDPAHGRAGLAQGAAYLVRPDTYVAFADADGSAGALAGYWAAHGLAA